MNEDSRLYRALKRMAKNPIGYKTLLMVYKVVKILNDIRVYFKRESFVHVNYCDNEPYSFNIYVCNKGKCESLFKSVDWSESDNLLMALKEDDKEIKLEMDVGMGMTSILIPKWAKANIIEEIQSVKERFK